jgi:hypothetical protein
MLWHSHRGVDPTVLALGATGWLAGVAVTVLALLRARARRAFVARVEAGEEPRFRVEPTDEGKVLVRIVTQGAGYRVADYAEEIARLDAEGEVTRGAKREE